ncbi:MAG: carboxypeptidase-like regulatory domain-containing protein [Bryobacteraceae bacterium]
MLRLPMIALLCMAVMPAGEKPKRSKSSDVWAVLAGTVFREPGFALPGAKIVLEPDENKPKDVKVKRQEFVSNSRGEFAFKVPAVPLRYTVSVTAGGYQGEKKQVEIQGEQRVDVYFQLKSEGQKP